jgi:hypothetical protein
MAAAILPGSATVHAAPMDGARAKALGDLVADVLDIMPRLTCGDVKCAPASAQERASPPVSISEADAIYQRGFISGQAERCGLDWQGRNYLPMMNHNRHGLKKPVRTMAMVGTIHGMAQQAGFDETPTCSATTRREVEAVLDFHS